MARGKYEDANTLMEQLNLDYTNVPDDIRFIVNTYNSLLSDLNGMLTDLDRILTEAEALLAQNKPQEARPKLDQARELIEVLGRVSPRAILWARTQVTFGIYPMSRLAMWRKRNMSASSQ